MVKETRSDTVGRRLVLRQQREVLKGCEQLEWFEVPDRSAQGKECMVGAVELRSRVVCEGSDATAVGQDL